jgi:hypothetical protein
MMLDILPIIIVFSIALIVGAGLIFLIERGKRKTGLDQEKYRSKWLEIENTFNINNETTFSMCIIRADSLLDHAMKEKDFIGDSMGERLKNGGHKFSSIDSVWTAHKIRNKIAHESDTKIDARVTRQALNTFKRALKDLGAI